MRYRPLATTEQAVAERVGDELVVYHKSTHAAHALSADAAAVWESCDGQRTTEEIAQHLGFEIPTVERAVEELERCELITNPSGFSRRDLTKKAAGVAGAAFAAPMIYSVAVPTAAWAGSSCVGQSIPAGDCSASAPTVGTASGGFCTCSASAGACYKQTSGTACVASNCGVDNTTPAMTCTASLDNYQANASCCSGYCYNNGTSGSPHYICTGQGPPS